MNKQNNINTKPNKKDSFTSDFIIFMISIISLFVESIIIIISLFKQGIFKKEILSKKTDLGFDLIIKEK
tara:strand:+ start:243 stop:449 length:207 start_codon:yes stop_codon:yes gene_type:complete